nr:hypothetical protein [Deltaproteobacteria bacterium]
MAIRDHSALGDTAHSGTSRLPGDLDSVVLVRGQTFRGLTIRQLLGAGAMGNAYLASHASLRMPVVVKLFR